MWVPPALVITAAYSLGAVPFAHVIASRHRIDLRRHGSGTVSGSGLADTVGIGAMVGAGVLDLAKGMVGPLLAGRARPGLAAWAAGATVAAHNWSPYLCGAGGRGVAPALGALLVTAPRGAAALLTGIAIGRVFDQSGLGTFAGAMAVARVAPARVAAAVLAPMALKRLAGNRPAPRAGAYVWRLLCDQDNWP